MCELVLVYTHKALTDGIESNGKYPKIKDLRPDLVPYVTSYRGGYTPEARRAIEERLFSGQLLGVVATNGAYICCDACILFIFRLEQCAHAW